MDYSSIGRDIVIIEKYFKMHFRNSLKKFELNALEGMILLVLFGAQKNKQNEIVCEIHQKLLNGATQEQIIEQLHYDKGVMARAMQALEKKEYVIRNSNPKDNRSFIFSLTQKSMDLMPKIFEILRDWNNSLLNGLSENDAEIIKDALAKMKNNAMEIANN